MGDSRTCVLSRLTLSRRSAGHSGLLGGDGGALVSVHCEVQRRLGPRRKVGDSAAAEADRLPFWLVML